MDYEGPDGEAGQVRFGSEYYSGVKAVYEELPGWQESTLGIQRLDQLPVNARNYLRRIEETSGTPIDMISTGPDRDETIVLRNPFAR